jgi:hypothetical protein
MNDKKEHVVADEVERLQNCYSRFRIPALRKAQLLVVISHFLLIFTFWLFILKTNAFGSLVSILAALGAYAILLMIGMELSIISEQFTVFGQKILSQMRGLGLNPNPDEARAAVNSFTPSAYAWTSAVLAVIPLIATAKSIYAQILLSSINQNSAVAAGVCSLIVTAAIWTLCYRTLLSRTAAVGEMIESAIALDSARN